MKKHNKFDLKTSTRIKEELKEFDWLEDLANQINENNLKFITKRNIEDCADLQIYIIELVRKYCREASYSLIFEIGKIKNQQNIIIEEYKKRYKEKEKCLGFSTQYSEMIKQLFQLDKKSRMSEELIEYLVELTSKFGVDFDIEEYKENKCKNYLGMLKRNIYNLEEEIIDLIYAEKELKTTIKDRIKEIEEITNKIASLENDDVSVEEKMEDYLERAEFLKDSLNEFLETADRIEGTINQSKRRLK